MKWTLSFVPTVQGRIVYTWQNVTGVTNLSVSSKLFRVSYAGSNYTVSWADIPSTFATTATVVLPETFQLSIELGSVNVGSKAIVDPNIISTNVSPSATGYTFQRKVFLWISSVNQAVRLLRTFPLIIKG